MGFRRQVIKVPGQDRVNSWVPEGLRVGDWLFCSLLGPTYTNRPAAEGAENEAKVLFDRIRDLLNAAGGTLDNLASLMVYLMEDDRSTLNKAWDKVFPDLINLPARQTLVVGPSGIPDANFGAVATAVL